MSLADKINLRNLDVLRGLLALYVLAGHSRWLLWTGHANWAQQSHTGWENLLAYGSASLRFGHEAVMVFFVLSGFFIHLRTAQQLARNETPNFKLGDYLRRRAHRLVPPYLLALLLTVALDLVGRSLWPMLYEARTPDAFINSNFASKGYSWSAVLSALMLLPTSLGKDFGTNGPLWSLAYEMLYYLAYPLWFWLRCKHAATAYWLVLLLTPLAFWWADAGFLFVVASHYYLWIAGAGLAELVAQKRWQPYSGVAVLGLLLPALAGLLLTKSPILLPFIFLGLGVGLVILFGCYFDRWVKGVLYRVLEALGIRSYTLYICHFPLLVFISAGVFQTWGERPPQGWLALLGGLVTVLVTLICFELCEKRFLHARLRLPITPVAPAVASA